MNGKMVLGLVKVTGYATFCLGSGILAGTTAYPIFKNRLGVKKVVKVKDIPQEEVEFDK